MSFVVEQRDDETGLWATIQQFSTPVPTGHKKLLGSYCGDFWAAYHKNHIDTRKKAVEFAKELYRRTLDSSSDVRVVGNIDSGSTRWDTCWKNGKWIDPQPRPSNDSCF